ncbi:hypothetical protein BD414DRAFT_500166 [Trametes punicea]|nr:hypothetical protein BD414DRAFT_500166 [Trametes punicea]
MRCRNRRCLGLLTGIMTLLSFIFSINDVDNFIWIGISMVGTKMYAITLLSALNSRQSIASRVSGAANDITPLGISGTSFQNPHDSTILAHRSHASQLRPTRTAEEVVSVIELKAIFKSSASSKASNAGATIVGFALPDSAHMGLPNRYAFEYHSV